MTRHQKCLPKRVFYDMLDDTTSSLTIAIAQLTTIALFFGMRSCEFTTVPKPGKTKLLQLKDVRFFMGKREIETHELNSVVPESVTVTFYRQKNGVKEAMISMHQSEDRLCPVRAFRDIVRRILSYPDQSMESSINTVQFAGRILKITPKVTLEHIRNTVAMIGEEILGFGPNDVGNHSIRSSFAMFLILNGAEETIVQIQGRWKSRAFMDYVRPQVNELSKELSKLMVQNSNFYTIPTQAKQLDPIRLHLQPQVNYINQNLFTV